MNINSSSNGLSWTAPVPPIFFFFFLFVCLFLFFLFFSSFFLFFFSLSVKKSFFMSLSFSRTWSGVRTHTPRLLSFLAMFCDARHDHHTFTPIIKHLITTTANKHPGKKSFIDKNRRKSHWHQAVHIIK